MCSHCLTGEIRNHSTAAVRLNTHFGFRTDSRIHISVRNLKKQTAAGCSGVRFKRGQDSIRSSDQSIILIWFLSDVCFCLYSSIFFFVVCCVWSTLTLVLKKYKYIYIFFTLWFLWSCKYYVYKNSAPINVFFSWIIVLKSIMLIDMMHCTRVSLKLISRWVWAAGSEER